MSPREIRKLYRQFDARRLSWDIIPRQDLGTMLRAISPEAEVIIFTRTIPHEIYKSSPYGHTTLVVKRRQVVLNGSYGDAVNEQREHEGNPRDFEPAARPWGRRIDPTFVDCVVNGVYRVYLSVMVLKTLTKHYYLLDGREVPIEDIRPFIRPYRPNRRQGTDKEIRYRDYFIEGLLAFSVKRPGERRTHHYLVDQET